MGEGMTCLIWCDACYGENWDEVSRWIREGRATTRSGRLKVSVECRGCGVELLPGESAEAITLHGGGWYFGWEDEYLAAETGWEAIGAGGEGDGREK